MNGKLIAAALAALVLLAGVGAAAPGDAADVENEPDVPNQNASETANENPSDAPNENASDVAHENPSEVAANADADRRGPPTDLPEQVPDHVSDVHEAIGEFLDGSVDSLGDRVSELTPDSDT